ncbi:MAG: sensor domain-containing diguanylate cyclase [Bauldia litoralis]
MQPDIARTWRGSAPLISGNRERARMLCANSSIATLSSVFNGLMLFGVFLFSDLPVLVPIGWLLLLGAALGYRLYLVRNHDPSMDEDAQAAWLRVYARSALASGTVWGLTGISLFFVSDMVQSVVVLFVLAGMTAGAATSLRPCPQAAVGFIVTAIVPAIVFFATRGTVVHGMMALILAVYILLMISIARKGERGISRMIGYADAAHEAADRLQIIADYTYAWEGWVDPNGKVQWVNPSVERVTGYSAEECYAMPDYPFCLMHPDDLERVLSIVREARGEVKPSKFEFRILRKDGTVRWCETESAPAFDRDGNLAGFRASTRDVNDAVEMREELKRLATTDPLTGAYNRRQFFELAEREVYSAERHGRPIVVAIFDIDHFKKFNDLHGHAAGDECLPAFVMTLSDSIRKSDMLARFGDEEFVLLMPETSIHDAELLCNRLRERVAQETITFGETSLRCTVSVGIACLDPLASDVDTAVGLADEALYTAKSLGRNRVVVHESSLPALHRTPKPALRAAAR